jgi:hypothetical protein
MQKCVTIPPLHHLILCTTPDIFAHPRHTQNKEYYALVIQELSKTFLQKKSNGTNGGDETTADLDARGSTSEGWAGWLWCGTGASWAGWTSWAGWLAWTWVNWASWCGLAGGWVDGGTWGGGWLDDPDDWSGDDDGGDGLGDGSGGGSLGDGGTWESDGGVVVDTSWERWWWGINAVTGQLEAGRLSVDDICVGAVDEVDLPSEIRGEIGWDSQLDGTVIAGDTLSQADNGWWPVVGLKVGDVDGEGLGISVDGRPLDIELLTLGHGGVEGWGQDLVGGGRSSQKSRDGESGELHYELVFGK